MEFDVAKEKAVRYLVSARKTEYEVRLKLQTSKFSADTIDSVIDYLIKIDYINDEEYVKLYVKQCEKLMTNSVFEIKQKLLKKGVNKDIIEDEIKILEENCYDNKLVKKLLDGKLKNMEEAKIRKYLYRRGLYLGSFDLYEG